MFFIIDQYEYDCPTYNITGIFPALQSVEPPRHNEVLDIITKLNNLAAGHDEINANLLKDVEYFISKPLTHVLADSLKTGLVSSDMKVAKI